VFSLALSQLTKGNVLVKGKNLGDLLNDRDEYFNGNDKEA
jgi:hypothetical protein